MVEREGGRDWLIVVGALLAHAIPFGLVVYSFTIFFPAILDEFGVGQGVAGITVSLATALMLGASSGAGLLTARFGARAVLATGALLVALGLALASASASTWQVIVTYGLIAGLGSSLTFIPGIASVGQAFQRRRGLAMGITAAGTGIGTIVMAPLASALIESGGWRSALRILAVVALACLSVAAALMPRGKPGAYAPGTVGALGRDRAFRLIVASSMVASFGYWVPFFFIAPYAEDRGISTAGVAAIVAAMGIANTIGRIGMGAAADRLGRLRVVRVSTVAMALAVFAWPAATAGPGIVAFGLIYSFAAGSFIALLPALAGDFFGTERLGLVSGMIFASAAVGTLLSAPVSGSIFDATDGYTLGIIVAAVTLAIGAVPLYLLPNPEAA